YRRHAGTNQSWCVWHDSDDRHGTTTRGRYGWGTAPIDPARFFQGPLERSDRDASRNGHHDVVFSKLGRNFAQESWDVLRLHGDDQETTELEPVTFIRDRSDA